MIKLALFTMRPAFLLVSALLLGCDLPPPPAERRGITYEYPSAGDLDVLVLRDGIAIHKKYLSVHWNLPPNSSKTKQQAIKDCVEALRAETPEMIANRLGLPKLSMDYAVFLVYRDKENAVGEYEFGLVVPMSVLFSDKTSEELLEIGRSSISPVGTTSDGNWDFSWEAEQVKAAYAEDGV